MPTRTKSDFEGVVAKGGMNLAEALSLLDYPRYFTLLGNSMPQSSVEIAHYPLVYRGAARRGKGCREAGKLRQEGKEYVVQDGDVMHFKFNV